MKVTANNSQFEELHRVFALQREHRWIAKSTCASERKKKLLRLRDSIRAHSSAIAQALHEDLRRSAAQPTSVEDSVVIADIEEAVANLEEWMRPVSVVPSAQLHGKSAQVRYEARGNCLLFGPWNFPFALLLQPLVPMIAAGNTAIVKPNEMAPAISKVSALIIREAFEERDVAVFEGDVDLAAVLLELPFDHIFFTGSPRVGRLVMTAAAQHLASVTLELGGKNPVFMDRTADVASTAALVAISRAENAGQICLCPDYVWVPNERKAEFLIHAARALDRTFYSNGRLNEERLARIVDRRNLNRIAACLEDAVAHGARVDYGGRIDAEELTVHPTILTDVADTARLMREEIFAPILVVIGYDSLSDAVRYVQQRPKPLALYIFSDDDTFVSQVLEQTSSGGVTINNVFLHCAESRLPFGGIGESGVGRYHGIHGFKELSHERAVFR